MLFLISVVLFSYPNLVNAADGLNVVFTVGKNEYFINNVPYSMDVVPSLKKDSFYVPVRFAAKAVGIGEDKIFWDASAKKVILQKSAGKVEFQTGNFVFNNCGTNVKMDAVPIIENGRMMLPLDWAAFALGMNATWNPVYLIACIGNDNAQFYYRQGYDYVETAQYEAAIVSLQKAVEMEPNMAKAYNEIGYSYNMLGQFEKGIEACSMAMGYDVDLASAYSNRAYAYQQTGRTENAIRDYTRAINYGLKRASEYYSRGSLYMETSQYNEALYDFNQAIVLEPDFAPSYYNRSVLYFNAGKTELAAADIELAMKLDGGNEMYQPWNSQLKKAWE